MTGMSILLSGVHTSISTQVRAVLLDYIFMKSGMIVFYLSTRYRPAFFSSRDHGVTIALIFLHRYAGWWGHDPSTRFDMTPMFSPIAGAQGFQQSNPSVLCIASLLGSLRIFKEVGMMASLRARSEKLTAALEMQLQRSKYFISLEAKCSANPFQENKPGFTIITPTDANCRGAQLSLLFLPEGSQVMNRAHAGLSGYGVVGDKREPDVIRLTPAPLYNTDEDVKNAALYLERVLDSLVAL
jgi:kynureninase